MAAIGRDETMIRRGKKEYVEVVVTHKTDGTAWPNSIRFRDEGIFEVDRVLNRCRASSTRVGGTGIRYTVQICGKEAFLYDEQNGKWYVETKVRDVS